MHGSVWKPIVGYEGIYQVSDRGQVMRVAPGNGTSAGRILKPTVMASRGGYLSVNRRHPERGRTAHRVHRLVADAFHGPSELPIVRHLDGDPRNNAPENLRHGTASENELDKALQGRKRRLKTHCRQGHEYSAENTRLVNGTGAGAYRRCAKCALEASRRYFAKSR